MKKIFISIIILSLIILTSFIKNSSKELDNKIYKLNAKIGSLNDKYDLIKLEYSYLTSPDKIEYLKNTYFNTFEEKNIVHQIADGTGIMKYALCEENCGCEVGSDLHLHFHCTQCNETVCLTDRKIPQVNLPQGYMADDINLVVTGVCNKCSGNLEWP